MAKSDAWERWQDLPREHAQQVLVDIEQAAQNWDVIDESMSKRELAHSEETATALRLVAEQLKEMYFDD